MDPQGTELYLLIKTAIQESEFSTSLDTLAGRVDNAQAKLEHLKESLQAVDDKLEKANTKQLAQWVSYNMLLELGNGFTSAAEANKLESIRTD